MRKKLEIIIIIFLFVDLIITGCFFYELYFGGKTDAQIEEEAIEMLQRLDEKRQEAVEAQSKLTEKTMGHEN